MNTASNTLYLSVNQVAERFNVSPDSIWRWKRAGDFPAPVKLGGNTTRWRLSDIEEWEGQLRCGLATFLEYDGDLLAAG